MLAINSYNKSSLKYHTLSLYITVKTKARDFVDKYTIGNRLLGFSRRFIPLRRQGDQDLRGQVEDPGQVEAGENDPVK